MAREIPNLIQIVANRVDSGGCERLNTAMPSFGEALRRLRKAARKSQDELGAASGLNGQTISNIETGKVQVPRGDTYRAIAIALGLTIQELDAKWDGDTVTLELPRAVYDSIAARAEHEGHPTVAAFLAKVATTKTIRIIAPAEAESVAKRASRKIRAK
jgi:transcriptional regulator with XRE-family HTH domain